MQQCSLWPSSFVSALCWFRLTVDLLVVRVASLLRRRASAARRSLSFHFTFRRSLFAFVFFRSDFPSLFLLSNSIHERGTLHHSVSLYLCLPFIFSTPFCTTAGGREGGRKRQGREREREMDRLGGGDKRSISRPNSRRRASFPPALPPLSTPLGPSSLCCASNLCSLQTDKGSLRNHFVCASAHKCVRMCTYTFACLPC